MAGQRTKAQEEFERFNKVLGGDNKLSSFESNLGDLQAAAKRQKFYQALRGLMTAHLPIVKKNLLP